MRIFVFSVTMLGFLQVPLRAQPTIINQPTNQVLVLGTTLTLSITASDPSATCHWFKDNRFLLGATNSTLTVANANATTSGTYYVVVTNGSGMVISLPASVAVGSSALLAWGYNNAGQLGNGTASGLNPVPYFLPIPMPMASNVVAAAAGGSHSLFVTADGTLWAVGLNSSGQLGNGTTSNTNLPISVATNVVAVAAGQSQSLFVKNDGTLWAMGTSYGSVPVPVSGGTNVVAVATGFLFSLFLKTDGTLWGIGANNSGQLGNGTPGAMASNVVAVAAGFAHSLFLKTDGTLWALGRNNNGQLGIGTLISTNQPVMVASNVVAVAAGANHSLFVTADGKLWTMGNDDNGQLGNGTQVSATSPVNVASNVVAVAAGNSHSLFLMSDGTLCAMGNNIYGQLGNETTLNKSTTPVPVASGPTSVANCFSGSSANHSLAIGQPLTSVATQAPMPGSPTNATLNGMVLPGGLPTTAWFEWGLRGSFTQTTGPVDAGSGNSVVLVSALISGLSNTNVYQCSLVASNSSGVTIGAVQWFRVDDAPKVAAWGDNSAGQLQVPQNLTNVVAVARGWHHSLALQADGTVRAWGDNSLGQCNVPVSATNVVALGGGSGLSPAINLALRNDGTVVPWGSGVTVPAGLNNVVAVAAGDAHCIVLQAGGHVAAWLENFNPPLYGQASVPLGLTNVVAVGGGAAHSLVLMANGTVAAWGDNTYSQTSIPPSATNVIAIAAGSFHNLALRADGTVVAWGLNYEGQTNVPAGLTNVVAISAGGFHSLALKSDGTVVAWGNGQTDIPPGLSNVVAFAACAFQSLALGGNVPPAANSQTNIGYENQDLVINPQVSDANHDALTCRVAALPARGAVYQYAGSARGPQITTPNTIITDVSNRVMFAPAPNNDGNPYATFGLVANDGLADSALATMTVNIIQAPQNLTAQNLGIGLQLQLTGTPNFPYILEMATNLTPPVVWQPVLTNPADVNGGWNWTITNLPGATAGYYRAAISP